MQSFPLGFLCLFGGELLGVCGGVIDQLGEEHGAAGGERPACPPQVEGGGVAVADRLFPRRLAVDVVQRDRDLDQLWLVPARLTGHTGSPPRAHSLVQSPIMPVAAQSPKSTSRNGSMMYRTLSC